MVFYILMALIQVLSEDLINKIAAGEVIERPASVVKELIENSLDAKATSILVEIKDSGKGQIRIKDNGVGMDEADARACVLRHATSKLKIDDDLFAIQTLGFRGEALSSIAAVSKVTITTKPKAMLEGFQVMVEGGKLISSGIIGAEQGTTIDVRNLFFNTPARKKFLKTDGVELRHIVEVVTEYALFRPEVAFKLVHEGHTLLSAPVVASVRDRIASLYGIDLAKELLEVSLEEEGIAISGFVAKPYSSRNDKQFQTFFVNGRYVRQVDLAKAVYDSYHSLLFVNKHPIFFLSFSLDPATIDVNIHPQKLEVKIEQKEKVAACLVKAVRMTLEKNNLIPVVDIAVHEGESLALLNSYAVPERVPTYPFEKSRQMMLRVEEERVAPVVVLAQERYEQLQEEKEAKEEQVRANLEHLFLLPPMKLLGQIHKTFFVAETAAGAFFIDQHAAHERVLYERFMRDLLGKKVNRQELLRAEMIELTSSKALILEENCELITELGFTVDYFGSNTFLIKSVPAILGRLQPAQSVEEVLASLAEGGNSLQEKKEVIITRMACREAVMAGEELTILQMEEILALLDKTQLPYTCPHGRPTIIKISSEELEKKFKRK